MKRGFAIAILFAGLFVATPALAQGGLAPGSLAPSPDSTAETPADAPPVEAPPAAEPRCDNCPPPRKYDSQEVVKTRRDQHHTLKTVNTYEMAQPAAAKESGGMRIRSDVTLVNFVVHRYRVIYAPAVVSASEVAESPAPAVVRPVRRCKPSRYGSCRPLRVRG